MLIGLVHGDVHAGVPNGETGGGEPRAVTQLREDRHRDQRPDPVVDHQRLAPRLTARIGAQLLVDRRELTVERVDHPERDRHLLARCRGQRLRGQPVTPVSGHQLTTLRAAVVIQRRLDPLLPLAALLRQRVPQPHPRAQIQDVLGRDPRLRQPLEHQQLPQMPSIRAITLRALLRPPQARGLRRLGQMYLRADPAQLLDHEPPASRRLQRHLEIPATEPRQELPHRSAVRRHDARALHLAGLRVDPLAGDLSSMLVKSHYDAHQGPPQAPRFPQPARTRSALELRRSLHVWVDRLLMTSFKCVLVTARGR